VGAAKAVKYVGENALLPSAKAVGQGALFVGEHVVAPTAVLAGQGLAAVGSAAYEHGPTIAKAAAEATYDAAYWTYSQLLERAKRYAANRHNAIGYEAPSRGRGARSKTPVRRNHVDYMEVEDTGRHFMMPPTPGAPVTHAPPASRNHGTPLQFMSEAELRTKGKGFLVNQILLRPDFIKTTGRHDNSKQIQELSKMSMDEIIHILMTLDGKR
jgi:hypothetical protein